MVGVVFPYLWEKLRQLSLGISDACLDSSVSPHPTPHQLPLHHHCLSRRGAYEEGTREHVAGTISLTGTESQIPSGSAKETSWAR